MIASGTVAQEDLDLLQVTDDPDEVVRLMRAFSDQTDGSATSIMSPEMRTG